MPRVLQCEVDLWRQRLNIYSFSDDEIPATNIAKKKNYCVRLIYHI